MVGYIQTPKWYEYITWIAAKFRATVHRSLHRRAYDT